MRPCSGKSLQAGQPAANRHIPAGACFFLYLLQQVDKSCRKFIQAKPGQGKPAPRAAAEMDPKNPGKVFAAGYHGRAPIS
jgi:hypothetical protein